MNLPRNGRLQKETEISGKLWINCFIVSKRKKFPVIPSAADFSRDAQILLGPQISCSVRLDLHFGRQEGGLGARIPGGNASPGILLSHGEDGRSPAPRTRRRGREQDRGEAGRGCSCLGWESPAAGMAAASPWRASLELFRCLGIPGAGGVPLIAQPRITH